MKDTSPTARSTVAPRDHLRLARYGVVIGLPAAMIALGVFLLLKFPASFFPADVWLHNEHGNQFYRAFAVLSGDVPFRDFEYQYGLLPLYAWVAWARAFGNTGFTCALFHVVASSLVVATLAWWGTRGARTVTAVLAVGFVLCLASTAISTVYCRMLILTPGANFEYLNWERLCFLALGFLWRPPATRTWMHAGWVGLVFLCWQATKFGGACYGMAGFMLVDVVWVMGHTRGIRGGVNDLCGAWPKLGVACAASELFRFAIYLPLAPDGMAVRELWPIWVAAGYPYESPWLWYGPGYFLRYSAPIVVPAAISLTLIAAMARRRLSRLVPHALHSVLLFQALVPAAFYLLGSIKGVGYFGRGALFFQYAVALVPVILLLAARLRYFGFLVGAAVYGAGCLTFVASMASQPTAPPHEVRSPLGVFFAASENDGAQFWIQAQNVLRATPDSRLCVICPWSGGGWYAHSAQKSPVRNWVFSPEARTPQDDAEFDACLPRLTHIVLGLQETFDFEKDAARELSAYLNPATARRIATEFFPEVSRGKWILLSRWRE